jgi:Family of unknown function (DUF5317)
MKKRWWLLLLPFALMYFGAFLNLLVINVNLGTMPVLIPLGWKSAIAIKMIGTKFLVPGMMTDLVHQNWPLTGVHLKCLTDWIYVPWMNSMVSPGDLFIWSGEGIQDFCIVAWFALLLFGA